MDKLNGLNAYQSQQSMYSKVDAKKPADTKPTDTIADKYNQDSYERSVSSQSYSYGKSAVSVQTNRTSDVKLSDRAQKLLDELKEKYGNADIVVAAYSTDEEARSIMNSVKGSKDYTMVIDPEELESMAADEDKKAEVMGIIDKALGQLDEIKNNMSKEELDDIKTLGFSINKDGNLSLYAELEKSSKKQQERIEEAREAKRAQAKEDAKESMEEKAAEKLENGKKVHYVPEVQRTFVSANSASELIEAIRGVDWSQVPTTKLQERGSAIDFTA